ncbi:IclR family transcriptional regulator domain-containing protein [Geodermatophilus marinus]|uniref:IclR family transcriptional regulator domain-containing protein n=1 Tax=Geodermatophilus sp. LHW52908 TaxID=2303986 RepID=UPI000E3C0F63|nr:IclR family transcriptional regulator C-terminal domain-containing protein [Geodermatophilus sp. LHW52908]RFU18859.1 IclR family transcriptional regulator [Geodermatophilus sp. LHW52908]
MTTVDGEFVRSLDRGLAVLRAFDADHRRQRVTDVAARTGLTRAAARRFLHTLVALGYATEREDEFSLRPRVLELGDGCLAAAGLPARARPHLRALAARTGEPVALAVLDGADTVVLAQAPGRRLLAPVHTVGARAPAYATSAGRVLLAELPPGERSRVLGAAQLAPLTRRTLTDRAALARALDGAAASGVAVVDQELEEGLLSVAVPVYDRDGAVIAALTTALAAGRWAPEHLHAELVPELRTTAEVIGGEPPCA